MIHLRIVVPEDISDRVCDLLSQTPSVVNLVRLPGVAHKPQGDLVLCDVAREDASLVIGDLKKLQIPERGSIAMEEIDSNISRVSEEAEKAAAGSPSDAVVWEEVESRTSEDTDLSVSFLAFMALACLIASIGILNDSPILVVGAMIVGPEFGPLAGFCVAIVQRRANLARRSAVALAVGFPVGVAAALVLCLLIKATGLTPDGFSTGSHPLTKFISHPDGLSILVAIFAGIVGMLSLTTQKSSALIGVLVSVTTIPAAANIGLAAAYGDWGQSRGAAGQLLINLSGIIVAGLATLSLQRMLFLRRRRLHLNREAGPIGGARGDDDPGLEAT